MSEPLDEQLEAAMDSVLGILLQHPDNKEPPDVLKLRIASSNLQGLCNVLLLADDPNTPVEVDLKQLTLGILATASWLTKDLPSLDEEIERNIQPR